MSKPDNICVSLKILLLYTKIFFLSHCVINFIEISLKKKKKKKKKVYGVFFYLFYSDRHSPQKEREINLTFNIEKGKGKSFTAPP